MRVPPLGARVLIRWLRTPAPLQEVSRQYLNLTVCAGSLQRRVAHSSAGRFAPRSSPELRTRRHVASVSAQNFSLPTHVPMVIGWTSEHEPDDITRLRVPGHSTNRLRTWCHPGQNWEMSLPAPLRVVRDRTYPCARPSWASCSRSCRRRVRQGRHSLGCLKPNFAKFSCSAAVKMKTCLHRLQVRS